VAAARGCLKLLFYVIAFLISYIKGDHALRLKNGYSNDNRKIGNPITDVVCAI
jgi:hypothetical protein